MANEHDVLAAWLKICREDTGAGSLVTLIGRSEPAVTAPNPEAQELPVVVLPHAPSTRTHGGAPYRRVGTWRAEVWAADGSLSEAHEILDRLETVTTHSAFAAEGLDVQVTPGGRAPEPPGEVNGYRLVADYRLTVTV